MPASATALPRGNAYPSDGLCITLYKRCKEMHRLVQDYSMTNKKAYIPSYLHAI